MNMHIWFEKAGRDLDSEILPEWFDTAKFQLSYGSNHSGGCQAVSCDGAVRFITESVEPLELVLLRQSRRRHAAG